MDRLTEEYFTLKKRESTTSVCLNTVEIKQNFHFAF